MAISSSTTVYGKVVQTIPRNILTLKLNKEVGMMYPIPNPAYRGYFSKVAGLELYKANLRQLIRTDKGERFMLPDYGCSLKEYLMEPLDSITFEQIKEDIANSISKYLDKITISKLQVVNDKNNRINVKLFCVVKDEALTKFDVEINI